MSFDSAPLLLGIDVGTTDTKCSFYTPDGSLVASALSEYSMLHPKAGWVEEDPLDWWRAVKENISSCVSQQGLQLSRVRAVGISCTNAFIPVDRRGEALHMAIMQIDQRSQREVQWIEKHIGAEKIYRITGNRIARGTFFMPTVLWYIHNCPEIVEKAYKFLTPSGYLICKLTGEFTINQSRMGFSLMSDIRSGTWSRDLAKDIGLDFGKLPRPCEADEIVGAVTAAAALETGLPAGIPVVGGTMDTVSAAVGAGAVNDGDVFMALGTCGRVCHCSSSDTFDRNLMNCRNALNGLYLNVDATNACGVALRWFRDLLGAVTRELPETAGLPVYKALDYLAERSPAGASGLLFLPYLSGERCPIWDPDAKGCFVGLRLDTGYGDLVRAIMEGVAFSLRQGMELMRLSPGQSLPLGGGIAKSQIWCSIIADVTRHPIICTDISETETLGDAILAGYATGLIDAPAEIGKRLIAAGRTIMPVEENMSVYEERYRLYLETYDSLKSIFPKLTAGG